MNCLLDASLCCLPLGFVTSKKNNNDVLGAWGAIGVAAVSLCWATASKRSHESN